MTLELAIPDTALIDCSDLRQKTAKIGQLARAFAVFRVEHVLIYKTAHLDTSHRKDADLMVKILRYMDTPQYLRKRVFPRSPFLKYAGILPPLRTSSHPLDATMEHLEKGMNRWGVQVGEGRVDLGLERLIAYPDHVSEREPTLFHIVHATPKIKLKIITREETEAYWGFTVEILDDLLEYLEKSTDLMRLAFSRNATFYNKLENDIKSTVNGTRSVIAIFGGPRRGIRELLNPRKEAFKHIIDFWINTIPNQGTETVRLEEAITASLALLNNSIGKIITKPGFYG